MKKSNVLAGLSLAAGLALAASTLSTAQDAITQRREIMKGVGGAAKVSNEMIKGEKPYDAKTAAESVTKRVEGWEFRLPSWKFEQIFKNVPDLVEDVKS